MNLGFNIAVLLFSFSTVLAASPEPGYDSVAVFKTSKPHLRSSIPLRESEVFTQRTPNPLSLFSAGPYVVVNRATPTTTKFEAEEHIAVAPSSFGTLVAAVSDFSLRGGFNTTKYALSFANGAPGTWIEHFIPLLNGFPMTGDGLIWESNSDPSVAIDKLGNVYLLQLYLNDSNSANGLYISVANLSAGASFQLTADHTFAVATNPQPNTNIAEDKPWVTVDNSNSPSSGNIYASWTHYVGTTTNMIFFSRSINQGQAWSAPIQINPEAQNGAVQGSQIAVGPTGEVYLIYEVFFVGGMRRHFLAKSVDGGQSFSSAVPVTSFFNELRFNSTYRTNSFPNIAISPTNGNVYVVWSDQPNSVVGAQIEFIRSVNGGASFSTAKVINDTDRRQQFMPALTVDSSGVIHTSWFDTRNSGRTRFYDIYAARSRDGGGSFSLNSRITPTSLDAGKTDFIGDYAGIAAAGGFAHPVWTHGGLNNGSLETATLR